MNRKSTIANRQSQIDLAVGLWPVMLTPFTRDKRIDFDGVDQLTDWYIESGSAGLFTVCLSSEMYMLTDQERLDLAERVVKRSGGRVPVVAAGTFGGPLEEQAAFIREMASTGVTDVVCLVNQLAGEDQPDEYWKANVEKLLAKTGELALGLYECPLPYHRVLTPAALSWAASTGRFFSLKETSGQLGLIREKIAAVSNTPLRFFNAHTETLLESLRIGGDGYSGIAANFYPALFAWLCRHFQDQPDTAERLQEFLNITQGVVEHKYPASAKQFLALSGIDIDTTCRVCGHQFNEYEIGELKALREQVRAWHAELGLPQDIC